MIFFISWNFILLQYLEMQGAYFFSDTMSRNFDGIFCSIIESIHPFPFFSIELNQFCIAIGQLSAQHRSKKISTELCVCSVHYKINSMLAIQNYL